MTVETLPRPAAPGVCCKCDDTAAAHVHGAHSQEMDRGAGGEGEGREVGDGEGGALCVATRTSHMGLDPRRAPPPLSLPRAAPTAGRPADLGYKLEGLRASCPFLPRAAALSVARGAARGGAWRGGPEHPEALTVRLKLEPERLVVKELPSSRATVPLARAMGHGRTHGDSCMSSHKGSATQPLHRQHRIGSGRPSTLEHQSKSRDGGFSSPRGVAQQDAGPRQRPRQG